MKRLLFASLSLGLLAGCTDNDPSHYRTVKLSPVGRVLMHQENEYRVFVEDPETKELVDTALVQHRLYRGDRGVKVIADVAPGEPMWATYKTHKDYPKDPHKYDVQIHIHSVQDINGAGWRRADGIGPDAGYIDGTTKVIE